MTSTQMPIRANLNSGAQFSSLISPFAVIVFLTIFVVTSRGLIEFVVGKQIAYIVQAVAAFVLVYSLRRRAVVVPGTRRSGNYVAVYAIVLSGLVSSFLTVGRWNMDSAATPLLYVATFTGLSLLLCLGADADRLSDAIRVVAPVAIVVVVLQIVTATAQQNFGWQLLSGTDYGTFGDRARPSGLTGSFLHYPLVLAVLGIIIFGAWVRQRSTLLLVATALVLYGILTSYSRSGMMILVLTIVIAVLTGPTVATRVVSGLGLVFVSAFVLLAFSGNPVLDRALSSIDLDAAGNGVRLRQWVGGVTSWFDSTLFFGSYTGLVTNISRNFGDASWFGVVESSLLQQLLNLGIVGTIATYWLLVSVARAVPRRDTWIRAGVTACILQTLIYQSIEVLPYIALLAIIPLVFTHERGSPLEPRMLRADKS